MSSRANWTIEELVGRVAGELAGREPEEDGGMVQSNGRIREIPDARTIRWYQTTGLVDRPAMRGRTALYGARHLAQVVAIKRMQAEGRSLAEIQTRLAGLSDAALAKIAALPEVRGDEIEHSGRVAEREDRPRFWTQREAPLPAAVREQPRVFPAVEQPAAAPIRYAVRLDPCVLLVLDSATNPPDLDDLRAIQTLATPLLDELRRRGLAASNPKRHDP